MRATHTLLLIALPLVAACAGTTPTSVDDGSTGSGAGGAGGAGATTTSAQATTSASTGGGQDGRAYFEANVSPIADAACASCHSSEFTDAYGSPDFLGGAADEYYDNLVGNVKYVNASPDSSVFLKKGLHTGPAFTAGEAELVETWLAIEAEARFGGGSTSATSSTSSGGNPTGPTAEEGMQAFGDCMTLEDWKTSGIQLVGAQSTLADGVCHKCHASGTAANYMTSTISEAAILDGFENMRYGAPLQKLVTWTLDPTTGAFTDIVQSYRWQDKGGEGSGHPKYVLTPQYSDAIDAWFDLAYAKWKSGACGGVPGGN
jgi:cytochrome c553